MRRRVLIASTLTLPLAAQCRAAGGKAVLELFTSQGCSSCPPADALLGELRRRPDVIALAWHVDYWNGLGWKDPYASRQWTSRQQDYARHLHDEVYTPALVVNGAAMVVGSEVVIRPMMYLALSYDHRLVDGREAVTFLVRVPEKLEDPQRLLLDI